MMWGRQSCLQPAILPAGPAGKRVRSLKGCPTICAIVLFSASLSANDHIALIDFFGYKGYDVAAIRAAIPYHPGDPFRMTPDSLQAMAEMHQRITDAVKQVTLHEPTDIAPVCCDAHGDWEIYIGIAGESSRKIPWNPAPKGPGRLPDDAMQLYREFMAEWQRAVQEGAAGPEDHSQGYALHPDEKLHAVELSIREYAVAHEELLRRVLASSSGREHRAVAATFTGYANQSPPQIAALVSATRDPDETVRNNATRALGALADGRKITLPADGFIEMLASGNWMDRNKAMMVLAPLTASGSPELLARIRARAIDALTEMSRWQCPDHSWAARDLLARVAR